MATTTHKSSPR